MGWRRRKTSTLTFDDGEGLSGLVAVVIVAAVGGLDDDYSALAAA